MWVSQVGKSYVKIKLLIEPFTFRKVRIYKDTITFACLGCEKVGKFVYARAEQISEDSYLLTKWPKFEDHICPPLKAVFSKKKKIYGWNLWYYYQTSYMECFRDLKWKEDFFCSISDYWWEDWVFQLPARFFKCFFKFI